MNGMPFDMVLAQPLAETFQCGGRAPNILASHSLAWDALSASLGGDPVEAWSLKVMQHQYDPGAPGSGAEKGVAFAAEFVRNPEYDGGDA